MVQDAPAPARAPGAARSSDASPSAGFDWIVVGFCFLLMTISVGVIFQSYVVLSIGFGTEFGASKVRINLIFAGAVIAGRLLAAVCGPLFDRFPTRALLVIGLAVAMGGFALLSRATALWQVALIIALQLQVAAQLTTSMPTSILVARRFTSRLGLALAVALAGEGAASMIFPPLSAYLMETFSWRAAYGCFSGLLLLPLSLTLALLRGPVGGATRQVGRPADGEDRNPSAEATASPRSISFREIARTRLYWAIVLSGGCLMGASSGVVLSIVHLGTIRGLGVAAAGGLASAYGAGALVGKFAFGAASDRFGPQAAMPIALACAAAGVGLLLAPQTLTLAGGAFLDGLGYGGLFPIIISACRARFGMANLGKALGWSTAPMAVFVLVLPAVSGYSYDHWDSYAPGYVLLLITLVAAAAAQLVLMPISLARRSGLQPGS